MLTQRKVPRGPEDEERLIADIIELARQYGRYGYRKIAGMLRDRAGWVVNDKRVERLWWREGLKVPLAASCKIKLSSVRSETALAQPRILSLQILQPLRLDRLQSTALLTSGSTSLRTRRSS